MPASPLRSLLREAVARSWWVILLRGIAMLLLGLMALFRPGTTFLVVVQVLGAFALLDGAFMVIAAVSGRQAHSHWWVVLLRGLLGIAVGVAIFTWPILSAAAWGFFVVYLLAFQALVSGFSDIVAAIRLRKEIENEWTVILGGVLNIVFGVLLLLIPLVSLLSLVILAGVIAAVVGITLIVFSLRLRKLATST